MKAATILIFVLILTLDILYHFLSGRIAYLVNGINLLLHIALVFCLLILDLELKYVVLAFLSSLLVYSIAFLIRERTGKEEQDDL